jgi:hypothetical protein
MMTVSVIGECVATILNEADQLRARARYLNKKARTLDRAVTRLIKRKRPKVKQGAPMNSTLCQTPGIYTATTTHAEQS